MEKQNLFLDDLNHYRHYYLEVDLLVVDFLFHHRMHKVQHHRRHLSHRVKHYN